MRLLLVQSSCIALMLGLGVGRAVAQEVTVSTATTTPVQTATANSGGAANVTVSSTGSITFTSGAALTLNSNNIVINDGSLLSSDTSNIDGILVTGGVTGNASNTGTISFTETTAATDSDNDGDTDGPFAVTTNRYGMRIAGPTAFSGPFTNASDGSIAIVGNQSAGMRLDQSMTGVLSNWGTISVVGDNATGVDVRAAVTGDIDIGGTIAVRGLGATGVSIAAPVNGVVSIHGAITSTGYRSTTRPTLEADRAKLDSDDLLQGGPAVSIRSSVSGGVMIAGLGLEDDADDDGDGLLEDVDGDGVVDTEDDADDDLTASILSNSGSPALNVFADSASGNIVLGAVRDGFGLYNRGGITASGTYDGVSSTAVRFGGSNGATANLAGGFANDRSILAVAIEANATAVLADAGSIAPTIRQRGAITANVVSENAHNAVGIGIAAGSSTQTVTNAGTISAVVQGETGSAYGVRDLSGNVTSIVNQGVISAQVVATDSDTTDNITPVVTGVGVAIDVAANTSGVTVRQIADTIITDDDTLAGTRGVRQTPQLFGDIRFGSGADTLDISTGQVIGDVSFGAGADIFRLYGGAVFSGALTDSDGALALDVTNATMNLEQGQVNLTSAQFGAGADLRIALGQSAANSTVINASGAVSFATGASLTPIVAEGLPVDGTIRILTSGVLSGASNVTGVVTDGVPFVYELTIGQAATNANALDATFRLKTAQELGLNRNQAAAFAPAIAAIRSDEDANLAFAGIETADDFFRTFNEMLPNFAAASSELGATAIDQVARASTARLGSRRMKNDRNDTAWLQEVAFNVSRTVEDYGVAYDGWGFGVAAGVDGPLANGAMFGLSLSLVGTETSQDSRREGVISNTIGQANAYLGFDAGPLVIDLLAGGGGGKLSSQRGVSIGDSYSVSADAEWWMAEGHATANAALPFDLFSGLSLTPRAGLTYLAMWEDGYEEEGGGSAVNLVADAVTTQRLWAESVIEVGLRLGQEYSGLKARAYGGWRQELIDTPAERTLRFASGGSSFTLEDELVDSGGPIAGFSFDTMGDGYAVSLNYEGEFRDNLDRHSLNAMIRFKF